uniref:Uncharacterized protein n=1 Tax=Leersia perrieri TaxID=77586 RepID=A0A0D9XCG2_9ORYZ
MQAEFKLSLNSNLSDLLYSPDRSLPNAVAFNKAHPLEDLLINSEKTNGIGPREKTMLELLYELSADGLEMLMKKQHMHLNKLPKFEGCLALSRIL